MQITYLGHAGFCVETSQSIVVMDPWMSPTGAFDSAWFQFPCNHHLAALVQEKLQDTAKHRYLYISHEHKDHFDLPFLNSLPARDFTLIVPHYRRPAIRELLADYQCNGLIACHDGQEIPIAGGSVTLYLNDSELDRDSAILLTADGHSFLNMNDCKIHDRLPEIRQNAGDIDAFACQFSGALWHPTCYEYSKETYQRISRKKMMSKFEATAKAIEAVEPRMFLPSAGPAAFLDPLLSHLNFEEVNIFPRAPRFLSYLDKRLRRSHQAEIPDIMPGDVVDVATASLVHLAPDRVNEDNYESYMRAYIARYEGFFRARRYVDAPGRSDLVLKRLQEELERKLDAFTLRERIDRILYVGLLDRPRELLRVDFRSGWVDPVDTFDEKDNYYSMSAPSWEIERVLDGRLSWEDFSLTLRMRLSREPDVYQTLVHGFLIMESEDLNHFCARLLDLEASTERFIVEAQGCRYSVNRFCPHQGADLAQGWIEEDRYLVCARHRWRFDLLEGGRADTSSHTIEAIGLEDS
ncbi:Rieske 2Fe-2S domain-containing protein [Micromonospora sp. DT47]|uniref:Rieske 2Fe-2S domain-containing protein n=1 Tax=Micromonospora sp. DT47 TaxID=3393431 RepID=UPI003CF1FAA6